MMTREQVVQILDETVDWYRTLGAQQQAATQPSDLLILYGNRQTADKVVRLAFDIARANAELLSSEAELVPRTADAGASPQTLAQMQRQMDQRRQAIQTEMTNLKRTRPANARQRQDVESRLDELQSELDLVNARRNLLLTMTQFVHQSDTNNSSANALKEHIDAVAASIPASSGAPASAAGTPIAGVPATTAQTAAAQKASEAGSTRLGIWDLAGNVLKLSDKLRTIRAVDERTTALQDTFDEIRTVPLERIRELSARGDALAARTEHATGAALRSARDEFDTLAWLFQQTSAILVPLSQQGVLLEQYRHNLRSWREMTENQLRNALELLAIRVVLLLVLLALVFAGAEVWRRAVFRYAQEPRRRYQLLLVRKIVLWSLVVAIIGFTFATELSSILTFAGLLTAGLAVAMQSVLVSIVGYFFLIGKYGIRVGDRIQIGTVTGEVIDLGLVRLHLMELSGQTPQAPTGRVVAFANSIVFQASGGLFKQIPGVQLAWREITLTLPPGSDSTALKERLLAAANSVVADYRDDILRQTQEIQRTATTPIRGDVQAHVQLRFSADQVEALVRYPVHLPHAAEIDERISRELTKVVREAAAARAN
ncbi:MAG: mechanosensitive ion channel [Steroidobacteraceae bacterium]|nr:mechanosensitive ion channel [Steroidobacteraceae bacterium]